MTISSKCVCDTYPAGLGDLALLNDPHSMAPPKITHTAAAQPKYRPVPSSDLHTHTQSYIDHVLYQDFPSRRPNSGL